MTKEMIIKNLIPCILGTFIILYINTQILLISYIPTSSMEPTLKTGSFVINSRNVEQLEREDIIVFKQQDSILIKRIIGMPGDNLEIKNNKIYINGVYMECNYIKEPMNTKDLQIEIPKNEYFVMGDNRNHSYDSRKYGTIQKEKILAKKL